MTDTQIFDLSQDQSLIKKVTVEMIRTAKFLAIDGGGSPTVNQKAFAMQSFLNPAAHVEPFIWACVLDAGVQGAGSGVSDAAISSVVAAAWPALWA